MGTFFYISNEKCHKLRKISNNNVTYLFLLFLRLAKLIRFLDHVWDASRWQRVIICGGCRRNLILSWRLVNRHQESLLSDRALHPLQLIIVLFVDWNYIMIILLMLTNSATHCLWCVCMSHWACWRLSYRQGKGTAWLCRCLPSSFLPWLGNYWEICCYSCWLRNI